MTDAFLTGADRDVGALDPEAAVGWRGFLGRIRLDVVIVASTTTSAARREHQNRGQNERRAHVTPFGRSRAYQLEHRCP